MTQKKTNFMTSHLVEMMNCKLTFIYDTYQRFSQPAWPNLCIYLFLISENESKGPDIDDALKTLLENADELLKTGTGESRRDAYSKLTAYLSKVLLRSISILTLI